jgi:ParB-like nuclease domain
MPTVEKLPPLCTFQKFTPERWDRRKIKNAPYNPRTIAADAERRLKKKLQTRGLLQAVTVNRTTGNLVGGHKRLAILDVLSKGQAYSLDVCVVKLTPKQEREENIAFNNPAFGGDWQLEALAGMFKDEGVKLDMDETGFDQVNLECVLGEFGEGLFGEEDQPDEVKSTVDDLDEMQEAREEEAEAAKGRRQAMREKGKADREELDTARVAMVVFPSRKAKDAWLEAIGLDAGTRYVDPRFVQPAKLKGGK